MRFRRFRRRRARAAWAHAGAFTMSVDPGNAVGGGATNISYLWLIPPARVSFLCDTDRVDHLGYRGSLVWLDFHWKGEVASPGNAHDLPDVAFYAMVSQADNTGVPIMATDFEDPWGEPIQPALVTSWDGNPETEGTDAFLWCHILKGLTPPNSIVNVWNTGQSSGAANASNQSSRIDGSNSSTVVPRVCRTHSVRAEWQPDIHIKTRRRLRKDEGVALVMGIATPAYNQKVQAICDVKFRTLVSRGR